MNAAVAADLRELQRLQALHDYGILDTPTEKAFDQLAQLAAQLSAMPMAVVNFVDAERQWFKASVGVPFRQTDRTIAFCAHALARGKEPLVVADASDDPLFRDNPLVTGEPFIRFYACVPLVSPEGFALGTLAVMDTRPRTLEADQLSALRMLADQTMTQLELRRQQHQLRELAQERSRMHEELLSQSEALRVAGQVARVGGWILDLETLRVTWSQEITTAFGLNRSSFTLGNLRALYARPHRDEMSQAFSDCVEHGQAFDKEAAVVLDDGREFWVRTTGQALRNEQGRIWRVQGAFQDITTQHQLELQRRHEEERFHLAARATADTIWDWDFAADTLWWSEGMQKQFGYPPETLEPDGSSWTHRLHPDDHDAVVDSIMAVIHGHEQHWSAEYRFRHYDGQYRWVTDRGFVMRDPHGKAVRMVGGISDVTAQKQADLEAQREATNHTELLEVQQRISSLDMSLAEVLQLIAQTVQRQTRARGAMVEWLEGSHLVAKASAGNMVRPAGDLLSIDASILWPALREGRTVWSNDMVAGGWDMQSMPHRQGVRSVMAVPLRANDRTMGSVKVTSDQVNAFSQRDVAQLELLVASLSKVIQLRQVAAQLLDSEQQYRTLFDSHPHPLWVYDRHQLRLLAVNAAMVAHYGYSEDELLRMHVTDLWPEPFRRAVRDVIHTTGTNHRQAPILARQIHKDGTEFHVEMTAGSITFNGVEARQVLAIDVTERLITERKLYNVGRAQRLLSACNEAMVRATSEEALLRDICHIAVDIGGYRLAWVGYAHEDEARSIQCTAFAGQDEHYVQHLQLSWAAESPRGQGPSGVAIRSGKPVIVRDIQDGWNTTGQLDYMLEQGLKGVIVLPLRDRERAFGLLNLCSTELLDITDEEAALLQELANDLAFGIMSLRASREQQRLQDAVLKVVAAVSASTGNEFFVQLARNMADALGAQAGCVGRMLPSSPEDPRILGLAAVHGDAQIQGITFSLLGTPSLNLLSQRQYIVHDRVRELYPQAPLLAQLNARAYVGQQLTSSDGEVIGMIFVLFDCPLRNEEFVASTLQIFAARAAAEIERQQSDARIRHQASLLDKAQDAIIVRDLDGRIIYWNKSAERLYGWSQLQVLGHSIEALLYQDTQEFRRATEATLTHGEWTGEIAQTHRDGRTIEVEGRWTLVLDDEGQPQSILAINTDISARKATEREIQRLAFYDALTGLPNRMLLMDRMQHALASAQRRHQGGALLFIDLDNFKDLNDTLGHDQGDLLLQHVAQRLTECVRGVDTVARLGGDEFVVMLEELQPHPTELAIQARSVGEKILATLSTPYELTGYQYRSTPSIGIAPFGTDQTTVGELLKQADLAMYQAKTAGRNTLRFFDPQIQAEVTARASLESDLRRALSQNEFLLHYQPQVRETGAVVGVEALVRWTQPGGKSIPPSDFIPLAEETGLILALGRWVLHHACQMLAQWQGNPALSHLTMAVNVSSRQFRNAGFVEEVARVLAVTGAPSGKLKLELTESVLVEDMEDTIATMEALRRYGVGFSLDDFGTGYSSLSYLKRMPLDQLKIDQSFVRDVLTDPNDAAIVNTIIGLSRSLGLDVIAEGVETPEQRAILARAGCKLYQGYLFSKPLPEEALHQFLSSAPRH